MTDMTNKIDAFASINAKDLARVAPFAAKQDVRYYLNGVCIEPADGGSVIVATNGHMMAALFSAGTRVERTIIVPVNTAFLNKIRAMGIEGTIDLENEKAFPILRMRGEVRYVHPQTILDGKFPDWRRVVGRSEDLAEGIPGSYNVKYLKTAIQATDSALDNDRYSGIRFFHKKEDPLNSPLVIRPQYRDASDLVVLVMPMRGEEKIPSIPSWAERPIPAEPTEQSQAAA